VVLKAQQGDRSVYSGVWFRDDMKDDMTEGAEEVGVGWMFASEFRGKMWVADEDMDMDKSKLEVNRETDAALRSGAAALRDGGSGYDGEA